MSLSTVLCAQSPDGFPKIVRFEGIQVAAFTMPQLRKLNAKRIEMEMLREVIDTLQISLKRCEINSDLQAKVIVSFRDERKLHASLVQKSNKVQLQMRREIGDLTHQLRRRRISAAIGGAAAAGLGFLTGFLIFH